MFPPHNDKLSAVLTHYILNFYHKKHHQNSYFHSLYHKILDFLQIAPFLKKNAIVILHDTQLHCNSVFKEDAFLDSIPYYTTTILTSTLRGKKFYPKDDEHAALSPFNLPNISAIMLDDEINIEDVFLLLTVHWNYMVADSHNQYILDIFKKHYDERLVDLYMKIFSANKYKFLFLNKKNNYFTKFVNNLVWWIPNKKKRNEIRNKLLNHY